MPRRINWLKTLDDNYLHFITLKPEVVYRFRDWVQYNGHIVDAFLKYARELRNKGNRDTYSAYCIRERIRWDSLVSEVDSGYKISNDFTPIIARLIMLKDRHLRGMFNVKGS